jgi:hypothetical protein
MRLAGTARWRGLRSARGASKRPTRSVSQGIAAGPVSRVGPGCALCPERTVPSETADPTQHR